LSAFGLGLLLSLLVGAFLLAGGASAANPSIINTGTGCNTNQQVWLVSCTTTGETNNNGNIMRISALVSHDSARAAATTRPRP
jgi:hypothetical protein